MERLSYEPGEIREAFRYAGEQAEFLLQSNASNWRRMYAQFVEAMTLREEALRLLVRLLDGHRGADVKQWFRDAAAGSPPALPEDRYGRLALVWKILAASIQKPGPDFDVGPGVDLPYVLANGFAGGSLGEKYEAYRQGFIVPFVDALRAWGDAIVARLPADPAARVDLWDAAVAAL